MQPEKEAAKGENPARGVAIPLRGYVVCNGKTKFVETLARLLGVAIPLRG